MTTFCLSTRTRATRRASASRRRRRTLLQGAALEPARVEPSPLHPLLAEVVQGEVLRRVEIEDDHGPGGVLGAGDDARVRRSRALAVVMSLPPTVDPARGSYLRPVERVDQLGLTVPVNAGEADDLARLDLEGRASHRLEAALMSAERSSTTRSGSPGCAGAFSTRSTTSRPTMRRARPSSITPSRGTVSISLLQKDHDPVGDLEHLVGLWVNEDDRLAVGLEQARSPKRLRPPPAASGRRISCRRG